MKKWLAVFFLLSACSAEEEFVQEVFPQGSTSIIEEPSEEELAELMKEEAEPARFAELNKEQPPVGKKVAVEGSIEKVVDPGITGTFSLQAADGIYTIINGTQIEVQQGDHVTIYGTVGVEKAADGTPIINALVVEK